ncbi:hypothetical protein EON62_01090 [archaeon]|nr:MAG: hypothetical protein EON62_01090 [archaeon]
MDYSYNYMQQAQLHRRAPGAGAPPAGGNSAFVALPGMQQLSSDGATGLPQQDYMLAPYPGEGAQQVPYYQPVPQAAPSVLPQAPPALLQGRSSGGGSHRSMILPHTLSARYGSSADDADILAAAEDEGGYAAAYRGAGTAPPASALQASGADGAAAAYGAPAITVPGPMATTGGSGAGRAPPPGPSRPTGASPAPSPVPAEETLDTDATEMLMSMPPGANTMRLLMAGEEARLATHFRDEYTNAYYNVELQVRRAVYTCIDGLPSVDGKPAIPGTHAARAARTRVLVEHRTPCMDSILLSCTLRAAVCRHARAIRLPHGPHWRRLLCQGWFGGGSHGRRGTCEDVRGGCVRLALAYLQQLQHMGDFGGRAACVEPRRHAPTRHSREAVRPRAVVPHPRGGCQPPLLP